MLRLTLALALLTGSCGSKAPDAPASTARVIRSMQLNEGTPSHITFESAFAKGTIEIAGDVKIGYQSITVTPDKDATSRQVITLDGQAFVFDGAELRIGEKSYGKLAGEVQIQISATGVTVNGEKR